MSRFSTIQLHKEELKFSAGHLMLLGAHARETLHGHDYQVSVIFNTQIGENGLAFDLREYRERLKSLCAQLDYHFILPKHSQHLRFEESSQNITIHFDNQSFSFTKRDVVILPIVNVTLEELSWWFLQQLKQQPDALIAKGIHAITVQLFNGRGESGASTWDASSCK